MLISALTNQGNMALNIVSALISSAIIIFVCWPFREFARAWVATKLGDPTPRYNGSLTLNPLRHIDPFGAILMALFGIGFGKGSSYDARYFRNPKRDVVLVAISGPISNILLGFVAYVLCKLFALWGIYANLEFVYFMSSMFYMVALINTSLAIFNLIPIPPLDGSYILFYFLPERTVYSIRQFERYSFLVLILLITSGVLDYPIYYARTLIFNLYKLLTFWF